ncbi:MAG: fasciclin domain-containing protein [Rubricoccaceae bacterium]|nr:fasciclin domain-containing protein [Rubricoccaceae bacterium]
MMRYAACLPLLLIALGCGSEPEQSPSSEAPETIDLTPATDPVESDQSLLGELEARQLDVFRAVIEGQGLTELLGTEGPFTILAPSAEAIGRSRGQEINARYHTLSGRFETMFVLENMKVATLAGESVTFVLSDTLVAIQDAQGNMANILESDIHMDNGVIHIVDRVLHE